MRKSDEAYIAHEIGSWFVFCFILLLLDNGRFTHCHQGYFYGTWGEGGLQFV